MFPMIRAIQPWTKNDRSLDFDGPSAAAKSEDVIALIEKAFQMKECAYVMVAMNGLTSAEIETLNSKGFRCEKRSQTSTQIFRAETPAPEPAPAEVKEEVKEAKEDVGVTPNFMQPLSPRPASQPRPFVAADIRQRSSLVKLLRSVEYRWKLQHDESDAELRCAAKKFSEMVKAQFEGQSDMDVAAVRSIFERGDAFQISIQPAGGNWGQMQSLDTARFGRLIGIDTQKWAVAVQMVGFF